MRLNEYQSNRIMNRNGSKTSSSKTQGSSRHDACRRRLLCISSVQPSSLSASDRIRPYISGVARIWCEGARNVASTANAETSGGLMGDTNFRIAGLTCVSPTE